MASLASHLASPISLLGINFQELISVAVSQVGRSCWVGVSGSWQSCHLLGRCWGDAGGTSCWGLPAFKGMGTPSPSHACAAWPPSKQQGEGWLCLVCTSLGAPSSPQPRWAGGGWLVLPLPCILSCQAPWLSPGSTKGMDQERWGSSPKPCDGASPSPLYCKPLRILLVYFWGADGRQGHSTI